MRDGILNLDKPSGPTSHDVVERIRALTGIRRVGHAGTLDPLASGVLLVCVGQATRVAGYLMGGQKVYRARVRLGIATDTYDADGRGVAEMPVEVNRAQVETVLARFRGSLSQVPPMYSALKREGTPLYRLARRGVRAEQLSLQPRQVEIVRLELTAWEPPECTLEVTCSPGTYVRTLAHDLGQALGCGAHLAGLVRLASGTFRLEDAVTLEELAQAANEQRWPALLHPLDAALSCFPALRVDADAARRLCLGQSIPPPAGGGGWEKMAPPPGGGSWERVNSPPTGGGGWEKMAPPPGGGSWERVNSPPAGGGGWEKMAPPPGGGGWERVSPAPSEGPGQEQVARAYGPAGTFLALVTYDQAANVWRPHKVFCTPER
jgi:tRNA pseudouridine55 synthase